MVSWYRTAITERNAVQAAGRVRAEPSSAPIRSVNAATLDKSPACSVGMGEPSSDGTACRDTLKTERYATLDEARRSPLSVRVSSSAATLMERGGKDSGGVPRALHSARGSSTFLDQDRPTNPRSVSVAALREPGEDKAPPEGGIQTRSAPGSLNAEPATLDETGPLLKRTVPGAAVVEPGPVSSSAAACSPLPARPRSTFPDACALDETRALPLSVRVSSSAVPFFHPSPRSTT